MLPTCVRDLKNASLTRAKADDNDVNSWDWEEWCSTKWLQVFFDWWWESEMFMRNHLKLFCVSSCWLFYVIKSDAFTFNHRHVFQPACHDILSLDVSLQWWQGCGGSSDPRGGCVESGGCVGHCGVCGPLWATVGSVGYCGELWGTVGHCGASNSQEPRRSAATIQP